MNSAWPSSHILDTGNGPRQTDGALGARLAAFREIPVIDFAPILGDDLAARQVLAELLRQAAQEVGFFYIRNHGVPPGAITTLFDTAPGFFAQPLAEKMRSHVSRSSNHSGYTPLLEENVNPAARGDLHEAYDMAAEPPDAPAPKNIWPENLPEFRAAMLTYHAHMLTLGRALFRAFALALGESEDFFTPCTTRPACTQRVVHYPSQDGAIDPEQIGIGAHSDYECFTILAQDEVPALQVHNAAGEWIEAPPIPGTFVVNIGDMMARWSNDLFASTLHRAVNTSGRARYSIPFFLGVNEDTMIDTLPRCITPERPRRYDPVRADAYVQSRFDATYGYRKVITRKTLTEDPK